MQIRSEHFSIFMNLMFFFSFLNAICFELLWFSATKKEKGNGWNEAQCTTIEINLKFYFTTTENKEKASDKKYKEEIENGKNRGKDVMMIIIFRL